MSSIFRVKPCQIDGFSHDSSRHFKEMALTPAFRSRAHNMEPASAKLTSPSKFQPRETGPLLHFYNRASPDRIIRMSTTPSPMAVRREKAIIKKRIVLPPKPHVGWHAVRVNWPTKPPLRLRDI